MYFHFGLISSFVLGSTALAHSVKHSSSQLFARAEQVTYGAYQAGVVVSDILKTFNIVTATFIAPWITGVPGSGVNIFAAIDGGHCSHRSLRVGVKGQINDDGSQVYTPYYRWYPEDMQTFGNVTVSGGDSITLFITAMNSRTGNVEIINNNNNQSSDLDLTSDNALCQVDTMWVVEPPYDEVDSTFYPLANFIDITFNDTLAISNTIWPTFPDNISEILNIMENDQAVTSVLIQDGDITVINLSY